MVNRDESNAVRWLPLAGLTLIVVLQAGLLWVYPWIPNNDGPAHQYSAWAYREITTHPDSPLAQIYQPNPSWLYPNAAYSYYLVRAGAWVSMATAEKIGASLYILALPLSYALFLRALGRRAWSPVYLASALALNYLFFMGFFNFLWGVPLAFLALAAFARTLREPSWRGVALTNLLFALTWWAHLTTFFFAAVAAAVLALFAPRRLPWAAAAIAPVALAGRLLVPPSVSPDTRWHDWTYPMERLREVASMHVASAFGHADNLAAIVMAMVLLLLFALSVLRRRDPALHRLRALTLVFFVLALKLPDVVGTGSFLADRACLFLWLFLVGAIEGLPGKLRALLPALACAVVAVHVTFLSGEFARFEVKMKDYLAGHDRIPVGAQFFPWTFLPKSVRGDVEPMATVHAYYAMALRAPNYFLYQAAPEHADHFPVRYTEDGLKRYPGVKKATRAVLPHMLMAKRGYRVLLHNEQVKIYGREHAEASPHD